MQNRVRDHGRWRRLFAQQHMAAVRAKHRRRSQREFAFARKSWRIVPNQNGG